MSDVKVKENPGHRKGLPKLKTILANPFQLKCPTLTEEEMQELQKMLSSAVEKSGLDAQTYAMNTGIHLGLKECLPAINNCNTSCVLICLNLRPSFLIGMIARNVEIKDQTVPVYAQPQLETFMEAIFGVQGLIMALPKNLDPFEAELRQWISARTKTVRTIESAVPKKIVSAKRKRKLKDTIMKKANNDKSVLVTNGGPAKAVVEQSTSKEKEFSGDYISFSNSDEHFELDKMHLEEDKEQLLNALDEMAKKIKTESTTTNPTVISKDMVEEEEPKSTAIVEDEESDDFLCDYKHLTVHRIGPNPDKKPKKKRQKNKQKIKTKTK